ncbi:ATP-dependent DNA helicase pif1-like [Argiope bruennichi]|uniref:ATP-dependent DNA helicase pif1-like n=1 Tax=Argiope bruennichi TaxID=94029 RepID=UPI0024950004|nr:ATP-dependent DNA helicase pif1-like [Argiope bruennichi]
MESGKYPTDFGLPPPQRRGELSSEVVKELNYNTAVLEAQVSEMITRLLSEQRQIYETILNRVNSGEEGLLFLDAPEGKGKTFVLNLLLAQLRKDRNIALAVSSSGIAETLLNYGHIEYSIFELPLNLASEHTLTCNITKNNDRELLFQQYKLIVWDKCTMSHKHALEVLNRSLQDFRGNQALMGDFAILLVGDFRQILPS